MSPLRGLSIEGLDRRAYALGYTCITPSGGSECLVLASSNHGVIRHQCVMRKLSPNGVLKTCPILACLRH